MIRSIWTSLFLLTVLLLGAPAAFAASEGFTVTTCGTALANPYTAGQFNAIVIDVNGNTCIAGSAAGSALPAGATGITGNASGTTGAVVATLPGVAGKTTWICNFNVSAAGTGSIGPITIAGLAGGSQVYQLTAPGSVGATFTPCLPASAQNTAITITTTADASATAVNVNSSGFQQ
jgi:hypothetical protein